MNKFIIKSVNRIPESASIIPNAYIDREIMQKLSTIKCWHPVFYLYEMELYVSSMDSGESFGIIYNYN